LTKPEKNLAIFDFDGTLFDTRMVNFLAYNEALNEHNFKIDYEYYCNYCDGLDYKTFLPAIIGHDENFLKDVHERKKENYSKYISQARINSHLFNIADSIRKDYWLSVVTTASKKNCFELLEKFKKEKFFDKIFAEDDIPIKKPDPQGFFMAIDFFSVKPETTIIFEDSKAGLEAAKKTGAAVYKVEYF